MIDPVVPAGKMCLYISMGKPIYDMCSQASLSLTTDLSEITFINHVKKVYSDLVYLHLDST